MNPLYVVGADLFLVFLLIAVVFWETRRHYEDQKLNTNLKLRAQDAENSKNVAALTGPELDALLDKRLRTTGSGKPPAGGKL